MAAHDERNRIELFIVSGCNISCGFCCESTRNRSASFMPFAEADEKMRAARDDGARVVQFMGGEPSLHPEFPELLRHAKSLGLSTFTITNLLKWEDPAFAEAVAPHIDDVMVSVHAHDAATGHVVTGRKRWFERFGVAAVNADRTLGPRRQAATVLSRHNVDGLEALASLVLAFRPKRWVLGNPVPVVATRMDAVDMGLTLTEQRALMPALVRLQRRARAAGTELVSFCFPRCVADPALATVSHDGLLGDEQDISDAAPDDIDDVNFWGRADYRQDRQPIALGRQRPVPCDDCAEREACGGYFTEYFRRHGTAELAPIAQPRPAPIMPPPRRVHLYGCGIAKTGSTTVAQVFREYRTEHEHRFQQTTEFLWDWRRQGSDPAALRDFVIDRDADELEVDSSTFNHLLAPALCEVFPEAKYLVTVRDPCSQIDSFTNMMQWNRARTQSGAYPAWQRKIGELCYGAFDPDAFRDSSTIEAGIAGWFDRHLAYWADSYRALLARLPPERALFIRTEELSGSLDRIADFLSLDPKTLVPGHGNERPLKKAFAITLPDLDQRVARICGDLLPELLPGWSVDHYRQQAAAQSARQSATESVTQSARQSVRPLSKRLTRPAPRVEREWFYVREPADGRYAAPDRLIVAGDGAVLTRRTHGSRGRLLIENPDRQPVTCLLRAAHAVDRDGFLVVTPGADDRYADGRLELAAVARAPSHHVLARRVDELLEGVSLPEVPPPGALPARTTPRALFFESLMNSDMPHNDQELSQGVLHMISPLSRTDTEVVLANVKMSIEGSDRLAEIDMQRLDDALAGGPIGLVCITLLEGYYEGVLGLIRTLRERGCRAHIAVGGVMPTLAPEHVAAHLPEVSFVCRGAGEYFVPALVKILGDADVDTPLTDAQRHALLHLDGLIAIERRGEEVLRLLSANSAQTVKVEDLDAVKLDLDYLQRRHVEAGIEISTSRGCVHQCSFCSIMGRMDYQVRSADSVINLLADYEQRFETLFGADKPPNVWRVHIADDDFACDAPRARAVFEQIGKTPFRLSSVQVSIADLCRKEGGRLLPEPDPALLDAIRPELFADHGRPIPLSDFVADHKSRDWSSYLQIGVETYSDRELVRLGKGYRLAHVRAMVAELAARGIHMDGYFILSNAETTASDLVDVFEEVSRLKLRHPVHFHMRFPVVPKLVSFFTSASHRRLVRKGWSDRMVLRGRAVVPGFHEFDYPFVDHDEADDALVRAAVSREFVTDSRFYTDNLRQLREIWQHSAGEELLRRLDDAPRRLVFEMLEQALDGDGAELALEVATGVLGERSAWFDAFKRFRSAGPARLRVRPGADLARGLALLASSCRSRRIFEVEGPVQPALPADGDIEVIRIADEQLLAPGCAGAAAKAASSPAAATLAAGVRYAKDDLAHLAALLYRGVEISPPPQLELQADGTLLAGEAAVGHLDDARNFDWYRLEGMTGTLDKPVQRLLDSHRLWRQRMAS